MTSHTPMYSTRPMNTAPFHKGRSWGAIRTHDLKQLALDLSSEGVTHTTCSAYLLGKYAIVNDATSEDGAGEWAVLMETQPGGDYRQIESVTFGWMNAAEAYRCLDRILAGEWNSGDLGMVSADRVGSPHNEANQCPACA